MHIREINKPVTAASLNESLAKKFGTKINLEAFTTEQLEDARNKLRTKLSQVETTESFDSVHNSQSYQKSKLFLDVLNAAIVEREDILEAGKPDFLDMDKDGNKKEPMKKAIADKKKKKVGEGIKLVNPKSGKKIDITKPEGDAEYKKAKAAGDFDDEPAKGLSAKQKKLPAGLQKAIAKKDEGKEIINNYFQTLVEGEEDKAEIVMAAKDMVDRITGWMEDTAEMQAESMLELGDAIRDEMGRAQSDSFIGTVKPALESLYTALESTRGSLTGGVALLTGEGGAPAEMGAEEEMPAEEPEAEMEPTVDAEAEGEDDFGAAEPAAGGEEEAGREKRESVNNKLNMLETSRRLGTILSKKK